MASNGGSQWTWSQPHQDYYYTTVDAYGTVTYHWYKEIEQATASASSADPNLRPRGDSGTDERPNSNVVAMPDPIPNEVRGQLYNLIPGTPERGWYEPLDSSYRMRTGAEVYTFFKLGKVFSMLHIQAASEQALQTNDSITVVRYGERAFSQIRRFVIVEVRRGFVYACPITTYSGRATLKSGCTPSEHSIVYLRGQRPTPLAHEYLDKEPICVIPAEPGIRIDIASRLHYGKPWPVEMNVKVKDIGDVDPQDLSNLLRYYRAENNIRD